MGTKSTVKEKAKAYLESLSEKQKRGILIAMLVFTCIASGIVPPGRARRALPGADGRVAAPRGRRPARNRRLVSYI
ncbi:hypothetical protein ACTNB5_13570, partial [Phocaeicola vulgatus]|uniref:hypothetical protein n=1 Tax=Phocaeicola vulgatus TaxID=821 RepID=UPI003F8A4E94